MSRDDNKDDAQGGFTRGSQEFTRMLVAMFAAGVATFAQLYSPQGILPSIASSLSIDAASAALMISSSTLGLAVFALVWAYIADLWGKSRAMFVAVSLATLLGLVIPWVPSLSVILLLRFVQGAALAGLASIAVAFIAEETNPLYVPTATGLYVAGTTLGGLMGRLIAGPVSQLTGDWRLALTTVSVLGAGASLTFMLLLPRARRFTPLPRQGSLTVLISRIGTHLRNPGMLALFLLAFTLMGTFVSVYNYVGFKLEAPPYLFSEIAISLLFVAYLLGTVSSSVSGPLVQRWGRLTVLTLGAALMVAGILLTMCAPLALVITGILLLTFGFFCSHSVAASWVGARASTGKAQATALYNVAYYLGSAAVGWVSGLFYNAGGWQLTGLFVISLLVLFGTASGLVLRGRRA